MVDFFVYFVSMEKGQPISRTWAAARGRSKMSARYTNQIALPLPKFLAYPWVRIRTGTKARTAHFRDEIIGR